MTKDTEALLPCPFCGAREDWLVQIFKRCADDLSIWSVECLDCGAKIESDVSQSKADDHWNTRAALATPASDVAPVEINWKAEWEAASSSNIRLRNALNHICDLGCCGDKGNFQKALDIAVSAVNGSPLAQSVDPVTASDDEVPEFLVARVSQDTRIIGIDHPTEADWDEVRAAHVALRDRLNERLEHADLCPMKPVDPVAGEALAKYAGMDLDERAEAMADNCDGDPWELIGYFREKLRQSRESASDWQRRALAALKGPAA